MYNVAIIENEETAQKALLSHLDVFQNSENILLCADTFTSAEAFFLTSKKYDIVFFDIDLGGMDGITAGVKLRERDEQAVIIFTTNLSKLAIEGYRCKALDYLVKPVQYFQIRECCKRALRILEKKHSLDISVSSGDNLICLSSSQISYIEVLGHKLIYHTDDGKISALGKLSGIESALKDKGFHRLNRGFLINLSFVTELTPDHVRVASENIPINAKQAKTLMKALSDHYTS